MNTITHILNNLNSFSKSNFKFSKYIDFFQLIKSIPHSVEYHLNSSDFIYHLEQVTIHLDWMIDFFDKYINPTLKKEFKKLKKSNKNDHTIPYADFKIDEPPVFKKETHSVQPSFEDILLLEMH